MTHETEEQAEDKPAGSDNRADVLRRGGFPARQSRRQLPEPFFIVRAELRRLVPYSMQHVLRLEKRGAFPRRVAIGTNRVAWVRTEVMTWIEARMLQRQVGQGSE